MKLLRYGQAGSEQPGILDAEGAIRDLSSIINDVAGASLLPASLETLRGLDVSTPMWLSPSGSAVASRPSSVDRESEPAARG